MSATEAKQGDAFNVNGLTGLVVGPKCEDTSAPGWWACITCGVGFPHNMAMQSHCDDNTVHVMAWHCSAHGPEVP